jgi:23S rRNA (uracil1939-C5)-methyltransferase
MSGEVEITGLGHSGHGVTSGGLFVPYAAPGDVVRVAESGESRARLLEILQPSPSRTSPSCRHFTRCGGCALQHISRDAYVSWKKDLVVAALAHRGFSDVPVDDIQGVAPGTRRRAQFKARKNGGQTALGFYEPESHRIVDVEECPILLPELAALLAPLRRALNGLFTNGDSAELHATATDTGIDLSIKWKRARSPDVLSTLAAWCRTLGLARLSWNGELVALAHEPSLRIGRFDVLLPPEPFLQPTRQGERLLQELVRDGVSGARHLADLFAGCGTFALSLAAPGRAILAADQSGPMIAALGMAARTGSIQVQTEERDLFRRPIDGAGLGRFDAVILDPPRPGAKAQAEQLALSAVRRIVYVSCNPASFARDARILANGPFRITRITPVDQFLWSPHVELVAVFERI